MSRILLCRTDALGDLLLTLPVARSLKESNPQHELSMLSARYAAPLLDNEPYLKEVLTLSGRTPAGIPEFRKLVGDLEERNFDAVIHLYPRPSLALATQLAGIPQRIGTAFRWYSPLFNKRVKLHRRQSGKHELDLNYELAEAFQSELPRFEPELTVDESQLNRARLLLREIGLSERLFVIVHPLSAGSAPNWSLARYVELVEVLQAAGVPVVLTGSAAEAERISSVVRAEWRGVHNLAGRTDLPTLVAMIKLARAVICGSTGPIHIATALRTLAVGIYPPQQEISPVRWGPRGGSAKLFQPPPEARTKGDSAMDRISVPEVAEYLLSELGSESLLRRTENHDS